ncbi:MAG: efflux RND transporter permease subunit [Gammaproteobacteria bacterium]|nr:efflux RND transporter permease subunit [Gammaproteobacteria bacterium]
MSDIEQRPPAGGPEATGHPANGLGLAGNMARFFINSPLSPLLYLAMLMLGILGLLATPRQEDPQISVPMVDLIVQYPGAEPEQVASLAVQPLERIMYEIEGVDHVYSASQRGMGIVTVQFDVGEEMENSLVKVNDKLESNMDRIPPGVMPPLVKAKGIDDVPVVTLTLWSEKDYNGDGVPDVDDSQLRRLAQSVMQHIKEIPDTGDSFVVGGRAEQVTVEVYPERLAGFGLSLAQVAQAITASNVEQQMGDVESGGTHMMVVSGAFLESVEDINRLQVGIHNGAPVYVHDVADVRQGPEDATQTVAYYTGAAAEDPDQAISVPAVTIAVAKKKGTNGVDVAEAIIQRVENLRGRLIPNDVHVSITRNYGKTAEEKVNELIFKLFVATMFVFLLVWIAFRALKPAFVVLFVVPVVLLFTILCAMLLDFTIDRVSLFALIFSIGILVDDAIVVVENIYRRWLEQGQTDMATAVDAVREVGNPTILATLTVIGALLPMGAVTGMMGPYMLPIPVLGSVAMGISLFAAFVFTPWFAIHGMFRPTMHYLESAEVRELKEAEWLERLYRRVLMPMILDRNKARLFKLAMWGALILMCSFFYFKWVAVKMLPLDNKPEFAVVLDMPEGTPLADTGNMAHVIAERLRRMPEVTAAQIYVGTARPFDFNGMVRHYYLRQHPWQAEIQVQLLDKTERKRSSHEIAVDARQQIQQLVEGTRAKYSVVEMPPGPPVLQSVVAEVHGPDPETRRQVARDLTSIFSQTESLRDVDNYMREPYEYWHFEVDQEKAQRRGISVESINRELSMALGGYVLGDVKQRAGHEPINIVIQVPLAERSQISRLGDILVQSPLSGGGVPLRELGAFERRTEADIIYNKDLRPVEYVVADVGGRLAAPIYGMLQVEDKLAELGCRTPDGVDLCDHIYYTGPPPDDAYSAIEWAGEWTVTYETFRDMGIAFGAALILIYILVVWEFGNFRIPALIMAPIPLTLLGIIPAHTLFFQMGWGGEFTATSMIGWIALAGIIVRNSILLVDFSVHRIQEGDSVVDAVISACKTRTRPILITALALVCGSSVIFFDPIFQGMAISLASGVLVSTLLTLVVIPLGCVAASDSLCAVAGTNKCRKFSEGQGPEGGPGGPQGAGTKVGDPLWVKAWSGFASVLFGVVGLLAVLFGGLARLLRSRKKPVSDKAAKEAIVASESAARPPAARGVEVQTGRRAGDSAAVHRSGETKAPAARPAAGESTATKRAATKSVATKSVETKSAETKSAEAKSAEAKSAKAKSAETKSAETKSAAKSTAAKSAATRSAATRSRAKPAAGKAKGTEPPAKKATARRSGGTRVVLKKQPPESSGANANEPQVAKRPSRESASGKKPAASPASTQTGIPSTRKKGSGRRGIQLKSLGKPDGDGLN